ncbi:hypothetical protein DPMN_077864 [Dreissena polymorpha]|uniref:Uncharacterized protein n=1 Tax=Dreissena polymorpha TaxID=45954 RepID=A0A9D3YRF4_DREPO|nr:hypothetical protein DPMN_077864 [Dreissena polymorpha]
MALVKDIDQCQTIWQPPFGHYLVTTLVMIWPVRHRVPDRSPGTGPVTGPWHRSQGTGPVIGDRSGQRSPVHGTGHRSSVTDDRSENRSPVKNTVHRAPVNMHRSLTGQQLPVTGQRSETDVVILHRIILPRRRRMHFCRRLVPTIWLDVGHALIHRAVLIPGVVMIITDHLDPHGDNTLGDVITVAAYLALGIAGIKVVDNVQVGIVVPTFMIVHITILIRIVMSPYLIYQFPV